MSRCTKWLRHRSTLSFRSPNSPRAGQSHPGPDITLSVDALPSVSVVVAVLNGEQTIGDCIKALLRTDYPDGRREIVIVDNGSTDRTVDIIRRAPVTFLRENRRGVPYARNRGIEACKGEIVAFTDADCIPTIGWLRELVAPFERDEVGGVAGEILPYPPATAAERHAARIRHLSPQRYLGRPILPFAVTANLAFRREVFERVGLFDPDLPRGGESTDFCTRFFRETGLLLEYAPRAALFHRHRATALELFKQHWSYGRGHAYLYIKYRDELRWGVRETATTYRDLFATLAALVVAAAGHARRRGDRRDVSFMFFETLRKLALRLGFAHESLARGRLRL